MRPEQWTPGQKVIVDRLRALLPQRPWWLLVATPKARCSRNGLLMGHEHRSWRSQMPPCDEKCKCVVWALTNQEARAIAAKRRAA